VASAGAAGHSQCLCSVGSGRFGSGVAARPYGDRVRTDVIVVNGGSSSGKTSLARCLQELLPGMWLRWSIDDLVEALPASRADEESVITFTSDGGVALGSDFQRAETAWTAGLAAMARAGTGVIVDDVFLSGSNSQDRLRAGLAGLQVLWVGVHCDPDVAAARETRRGNRAAGMAASQSKVVHRASCMT
jgi:chloramphenicol 3-O phosphotransferase